MGGRSSTYGDNSFPIWMQQSCSAQAHTKKEKVCEDSNTVLTWLRSLRYLWTAVAYLGYLPGPDWLNFYWSTDRNGAGLWTGQPYRVKDLDRPWTRHHTQAQNQITKRWAACSCFSATHILLHNRNGAQVSEIISPSGKSLWHCHSAPTCSSQKGLLPWFCTYSTKLSNVVSSAGFQLPNLRATLQSPTPNAKFITCIDTPQNAEAEKKYCFYLY